MAPSLTATATTTATVNVIVVTAGGIVVSRQKGNKCSPSFWDLDLRGLIILLRGVVFLFCLWYYKSVPKGTPGKKKCPNYGRKVGKHG